MSGNEDLFESNGADISAMVARGAAGLIPGLGGFVGEIISNQIPNQRIDRIAQYVEELNAKFESLDADLIKKLCKNELFIDLVEESFIKASRALTNERRLYILHLVEHGMSNEEVDINNAKYLLGLLSDLNDSEVLWLRFYHERTIVERQRFQGRYQNVLTPIVATLGDNLDKKRQETIQESYTEHLERLGLVTRDFNMNSDLGVPKYDVFTNKPEVRHTEANVLGRMLLEYIGLIDKQTRRTY